MVSVLCKIDCQAMTKTMASNVLMVQPYAQLLHFRPTEINKLRLEYSGQDWYLNLVKINQCTLSYFAGSSLMLVALGIFNC